MADRRAKLKVKSLERGASEPLLAYSKLDRSERKERNSSAAARMGHEFKRKTYYKPTYCQHCTELLWGLVNQGYQCTVCNFVSHERCISLLAVDCTHMLSEKIVTPIAHDWIGPKTSKNKRKWCNVCRKKIHGVSSFCKICRQYSHEHCVHNALNNCKNCASFTNIGNTTVAHYWIEGNLPSTAKCEKCLKGCYTDLCLAGFRCGWCGITLHSYCFDSYASDPRNQKCTFRDLSFMILPPNVVTVPVKQVSWTEDDDETVDEDDVPRLFAPSEEEQDKGGRQVIVIDGSGMGTKLRKRTLHPTHVDATTTVEELLRVSLRKCSITQSPSKFYLSEAVVDVGGEREILPSEVVCNLPQAGRGLLKLYIRKREAVQKGYTLKVFNSKLSTKYPFVNIMLEEGTTTVDVISKALVSFELEEEKSDNYSLYEISQVKGVSERVLPGNENLLKRIYQMEKNSLKDLTQLRYYLHPKETVPTTLFLWKVDSSHLESPSTVIEFIKDSLSPKQLSEIQVGPIFPKLGSCLINTNCVATAQQLYSSLASSDKCCNIQALPTLHEGVLDVSQEPILVFINGRSGGNQGYGIINGLCRHLNPYQVFDLSNGGPLPGLYMFRNLSKYRVLVGGGDGTVGWVLSGLDTLRDHLKFNTPPCAVLPLGTGNDLARALKWGGGFTGEKTMQLLFAIEDANCSDFDRWQLDFKDFKDSTNYREGEVKSVVMNNYLGIGIDAEIALDFHLAREDHPEKFNSQFHNRGVYFQLGVQKTFSRDMSTELHTNVVLKVDGKFISMPTGLKGIVILNIESWGGGSKPWGSHTEEGFCKNTSDDGILEIMGLTGPVHLGQIKGGLKNGLRIAQGKTIVITLSQMMHIQVDGEAWIQEPSMIEIHELPYKAKMLSKSPQSFIQRGLTHREARSLIHRNSSEVTLTGSGLSGRRQNVVAGVPELKKGVSTRTIYHKVEEND